MFCTKQHKNGTHLKHNEPIQVNCFYIKFVDFNPSYRNYVCCCCFSLVSRSDYEYSIGLFHIWLDFSLVHVKSQLKAILHQVKISESSSVFICVCVYYTPKVCTEVWLCERKRILISSLNAHYQIHNMWNVLFLWHVNIGSPDRRKSGSKWRLHVTPVKD